MGFFVSFLVSMALMVVGELLRPKQPVQNAEPSSLDDFDLPTAEEGRAIPLVVGKVKISGPNVTYYGDLRVEPLTRKVKTGLFSSKRQTYAYRYYMGMQMFLCRSRPDFEIHEIRFGDEAPVAVRTNEANGVVRFAYNDFDFFGGDEKEGGIAGTLRFYRGSELQDANTYFSTQLGRTAPAYRGYCYAMFEQMYLGTSQYIKPVSFLVSSYPNTLGVTGNRHKIGEDANPVCFIYEILNDSVWGLGVNPAQIDVPAFVEAATTVFNEGYGISMIVNASNSGGDLIAEVLRHIDGIVFTDPTTGLITIKLARADYVLEDLPTYSPDDFSEGIKFSRSSWSQTKNSVTVSYTSRENDYKEASLTHQDLANIVQRGGEISAETVNFRGFSTATAANLAAARVLKTYSYPLAKVTCALPRRLAWKLRPGSVFRMNWPARGIAGAVFRVVRIDYGGLKSNRIDIDAVEDIFSISNVAYTPPARTSWVNPLGPPQPLARQGLFELPYALAPIDGSTVATFGTRTSGVDENYRVWSDRASPFTTFEQRATVDEFTASAVMPDALPAGSAARLASGFRIDQLLNSSSIDLSVREDEMLAGASLVLVTSAAGEEWMAYRSVQTVGSDTFLRDVLRGVLDTVPLSHPAGARLWFAATGFGVENVDAPYNLGQSIAVKLLPSNARGVLPIADAVEMQITTTSRGARPIVPGRIRVNGTHPAALSGSPITSLAVSWAHRSRLNEALSSQDDLSVAPEDGTIYRVVARRADTDALLAQGTGNLTSASITLNYTGLVRVIVTAERAGLASFAAHSFAVNYQATGTPPNVVAVDSAQFILDGGGA